MRGERFGDAVGVDNEEEEEEGEREADREEIGGEEVEEGFFLARFVAFFVVRVW